MSRLSQIVGNMGNFERVVCLGILDMTNALLFPNPSGLQGCLGTIFGMILNLGTE